MSKRVFSLNRSGLVLAGFAFVALAGCSSQPVVSNFPDLRLNPAPIPALLTPEERYQAIEDLQNAGAQNLGG
ncbi:hypothetical protein MNBD_ALPHA09-595 [hydrothermal vent metagenome]|uniref:Uncharacterized protein n=1 Tax=hydrothermal vent metagenome TaxID=652676 RepID=A0A3B0TXT3_9ZZZZ